MTVVAHRTIEIDGIRTFYREAGPPQAPVVLLPHGYPSSSFQFRQLIPALADRWHVIAPDYPGFGYSDVPDPAEFSYTFAGYTEFMQKFIDTLKLERFCLYMHDYGSQIGMRLALRKPGQIACLVVQNGDVYEDQFGPKYQTLREYWANPTPGLREKLAAAVSEQGLRDEFIGEVPPDLVERISPDLWKLSWPLMQRPRVRDIMVGLFEDIRSNLELYPEFHAYLRKRRPPLLIVWGPYDGYMPEGAARAYLRDRPDAELHLLRGGHWALETDLDAIVARMRDFLERKLSAKRL